MLTLIGSLLLLKSLPALWRKITAVSRLIARPV